MMTAGNITESTLSPKQHTENNSEYPAHLASVAHKMGFVALTSAPTMAMSQ